MIQDSNINQESFPGTSNSWVFSEVLLLKAFRMSEILILKNVKNLFISHCKTFEFLEASLVYIRYIRIFFYQILFWKFVVPVSLSALIQKFQNFGRREFPVIESDSWIFEIFEPIHAIIQAPYIIRFYTIRPHISTTRPPNFS